MATNERIYEMNIRDRQKHYLRYAFTPLESPGIYAGDAINRKHQLLIEDGVKAPSFLTGFTVWMKVIK